MADIIVYFNRLIIIYSPQNSRVVSHVYKISKKKAKPR